MERPAGRGRDHPGRDDSRFAGHERQDGVEAGDDEDDRQHPGAGGQDVDDVRHVFRLAAELNERMYGQ